MALNERYEGDIYRAVFPSIEIERAGKDGNPMLRMVFAVFDRWTEINSAFEGHFLERIAPGAFRKTLNENLGNIRTILSHGKDPSMGMTVLGRIKDAGEEGEMARANVELFPSVPQLLVDGLKAGVYGASFRGTSVKERTDWNPDKSEHNPEGLPEVTRTEIRLKDIGPTPFAQYAETESVIRSETDDLVMVDLSQNQEFMRGLATLLEPVRAATLDAEDEPDAVERTTPLDDEPPHSAEEDVNEKEELPLWHLSR